MSAPAAVDPGAVADGVLAATRARCADPIWRLSAAGGVVLLGALVLASSARGTDARVVAVAVAAGVLAVCVALLVPGAVRALRGGDGRSLLGAAALLAASPLVALTLTALLGFSHGSAVVPLAFVLAIFGLALIGDDLRTRAHRAGRDAARTPWQRLTAVERVRRLPWRVVVGALLVGWSAVAGLLVVGPAVVGDRTLLIALVLVVVLAALAVVGLPVLVSVAAGADRTRLASAREQERLRMAAHLHDSVLQTLSLVQRQAHDPAAVAHLAHRQERALRAWLAGDPESRSDTLAGALEAAVEQVEEQERTTVAVTLNGDRPLDGAGDDLVAATREALRNAARHAGGAAIVMFAEIEDGAVAIYVRDEGPGFDLAAVPHERRGVRDAIVGRMAAIGGHATVETQPGEGTEVTLRLPAPRRGGGGPG
jgi:signal transduction histidine kinase